MRPNFLNASNNILGKTVKKMHLNVTNEKLNVELILLHE